MSFAKNIVVMAACAALLNVLDVSAAQTNVIVGDNFFNPRNVTITRNDAVRWVWGGSDEHSTTHSGSPRLWDSGVKRSGSFTNVFTATGTFPYFCTEHSSQTGSVIVQQGANTPPTVTITNPANNSVFAAPATFVLAASASDAGGSVAQLEFFRGTTSLGTDTSSPYSVNVSDLAAGTYTFSAVALDNGGARATNAISVSVVNAAAPQISSPQRVAPGQFRFSYSANAGLRYAVDASSNLTQWRGVVTNMATGPTVNVTNPASATAEFYRVRRLANP
jgi:plastocyanin